MTAIQISKMLMKETKTSYPDLSKKTDLGSPSNICQMLSHEDMKVSTFIKILEAMDFQLVVQDGNFFKEDFVVDID